MVRAPPFEAEVFCGAAIFEFFQNRLAFWAQKKVRQEQSAVGVRRLDSDGSAADVRWHDVHRQPIHRRPFRDRVQRMVAEDRRRCENFTRCDQIEKRRGNDRVEGDLLCLELFDQFDASGPDNRTDDLVGRIADGHSHAAF